MSPNQAEHIRAILRGSDAVWAAVPDWLDRIEADAASAASGPGEAR